MKIYYKNLQVYPREYLEKLNVLWYSIVTSYKKKRVHMKKSSLTIKKKMLWVLIAVSAILLLLLLLIQMLSRCTISPLENSSETTHKAPEFKFSDEYITERAIFDSDEDYLTYDRTIYFHDPQTGVTEGIEGGNYDNFGAGTALLCEMIASIIDGDAEAYNTFFSDIYYKENEEKSAFSMQKLYDILITEYSKSEETSESGGTYKEYIYELKYKIKNNNGSFRSDMGSDSIRTQYFLITNRSGKLQIDGIYTYGERY